MKIAIWLIIFFIVVVTGVTGCVNHVDNNIIKRYHVAHHETVVDVDRCLFKRGPYWLVDKNIRIYKVTTSNGNVYWWRLGGFFKDVYKELPDGKYIEIE